MNKTIKLTTIFSLAIVLAGCSDRRREYRTMDIQAPSQATNIDIPPAPQNKFGFREALSAPSIMPDSIVRRAGGPEAFVAPGVSTQSAPGVAFSYRYAFVLPDEAISLVQERHAAACEALGPSKCRITGMRFTRVDESRVAGYLQFKLAPELARQFGKDGIAAVDKAKGKLVDAAIEGVDVGAQMSDSQRRSGDLQALIASSERRLAGRGLDPAEREALIQQVAESRRQLAQESATRAQGAALLADTPMTYTYAGTEGFTPGDHPVGDAADSFQYSFSTMVAVVLTTFGVVLPWLVPLGLLGWLALALRRRWRKPGDDAAASAETVPTSEREA